MKLLFLDESGDHSLDVIDDDYPVFVLGGVIVDRSYYRRVLEPRVRQLKEEFFDNDVVLHTTDIVRAKNGFEVLVDAAVRRQFYRALNLIMRELEYTVLACAIRKHDHRRKYGSHAADPYDYALEVVVERFVKDIGDVEHGGMIFAEMRRPDLDKALQMTWKDMRENGCGFAKADHVDGRIIDLSLKDKNANLSGLELADLVVSPIGRHVIGKPDREDWSIIESKFRRGWTGYEGYGLVVLPETK